MANKSKDVEKRPVGKNDKVVCVTAVNINSLIDYDKASKKYRDVLEVTNAEKVDTILSYELGKKEVSIKAKDMDENMLIYFEKAKHELEVRKQKEAKNNIISIKNGKGEGRDIG